MSFWNKVGQRTQKQNGTEQTLFSNGTENPKTFLSRAFPIASFSHPLHKSYCKLFPLRPACCLASSQQSSPQHFHCFIPSPPSAVFLKLFPRLHPVEHPVSLPPSAISPLFPRLHPVEHPVSLPPSAVFLSYFHGFIPSSIRSRSPSQRSFPAISTASSRRASGLAPSQDISSSYFHGFIPSSIRSRSLPAQFSLAISTASSRRASGLAPSQRSFPKLFPRLHPVEHPVSLPPSAVSPLFPRLHPVEHPVSLPPKIFPQAISTASSRRASGLAPSQRSFP